MKMHLGATALALILSATAVSAETAVNAEVSAGAQADLQNLLDDLRAFRDENANAITAGSRDELDEIIARYSAPDMVAVVDDSFADGNYTGNPGWRVENGVWSVERGRLMSDARVSGEADAAPTQEEAIAGLLGAAIGAATGERFGLPSTRNDGLAVIGLNQSVSNAFDVTMVIEDRGGEGSLHMALYQQGETWPGYRLAYDPAGTPTLSLVKVTSRGSSEVAAQSSADLSLEGDAKEIRWQRDAAGAMTVSVDGEVVLTRTDTAFGDPFTGIGFINNEGYYAIDSVTVKGAEAS